jgi:glycosyltransferase involved in cell wall biosynthesis
MNNNNMHFTSDVTVSVWNDFWAPELCEGLARSGYRVLALRSENTPIPGVTTACCYISKYATRLFQRTQIDALCEVAQSSYESFARHRAGQSQVFWGWNGHNLRAFERAKAAGQRVLCERGSTHAAWAARRLNKVHRELGWGPTNIEMNSRELRAIEEYDLAEKIIVPSKFVKNTFLQEGIPHEKLEVNPYGVDLDRWSRIEGTHRASSPLVFVFTASMTPRKGVHTLLHAWHQAGLKDAELWMCGGVHFPIQELQIPVDSNVKFLGYTQHAQLEEIYTRASVYVLASFEEGMARSGIEALAAGLPIIVTEETGLTDLMTTGREGWIISSGDVEQLAETLRSVASNRHDLLERSLAAQSCTANSSKRDYGDRAAKFLRLFLQNCP